MGLFASFMKHIWKKLTVGPGWSIERRIAMAQDLYDLDDPENDIALSDFMSLGSSLDQYDEAMEQMSVASMCWGAIGKGDDNDPCTCSECLSCARVQEMLKERRISTIARVGNWKEVVMKARARDEMEELVAYEDTDPMLGFSDEYEPSVKGDPWADLHIKRPAELGRERQAEEARVKELKESEIADEAKEMEIEALRAERAKKLDMWVIDTEIAKPSFENAFADTPSATRSEGPASEAAMYASEYRQALANKNTEEARVVSDRLREEYVRWTVADLDASFSAMHAAYIHTLAIRDAMEIDFSDADMMDARRQLSPYAVQGLVMLYRLEGTTAASMSPGVSPEPATPELQYPSSSSSSGPQSVSTSSTSSVPMTPSVTSMSSRIVRSRSRRLLVATRTTLQRVARLGTSRSHA